MIEKLCRVAAAVVLGAFLGLVGATILWGWIYGIGSAVITDELYGQLSGSVSRAGLYVGASTAVLRSVFPHRGLMLSILVQHVLGMFAGCFGGSFGWREGLTTYFGAQSVVLVAAAVYSVHGSFRRSCVNAPSKVDTML